MNVLPGDGRGDAAVACPTLRKEVPIVPGTVNRRVAVLFIIATLISAAAGCDRGPSATPPQPRNVVLMIGDGMGLSHITAAMATRDTLHMERLTVGGLVATHPHGSFVTDSAAGATAYATGRRTANGSVSVDPEGERLKTVLEHAEERGMATGLVATCSVTHATPAAFAAHVGNRERYLDIAEQLASSGVDVLFGGGQSHFLPSGKGCGVRADGADLVDSLRRRMPVALTAEEFRSLENTDAACALLAPDYAPAAGERDPDLAELTTKALEILSRDPDGFFLMVEGSQIDWAAHQSEHDWLVAELADFDDAVGVVMDFAERDGGTLVVVTSDHETGGYAVLDGSLDRREISAPLFSTDGHTGSMVPLLAYGPGSDVFGGMLDNAEVGQLLLAAVTRR